MTSLSKYDRLLKPSGVRLHFGRAPHAPRRGQTFAQRRGIAYERWVAARLAERWGDAFIPGLWFTFWDSGRPSAVQLDGLLIDLWAGVVWIIECKWQHTHTAWEQMNNFYKPVVKGALGTRASWSIRLVEVCAWCEWSVFGPPACPITRLEDAQEGAFNVLQMRKR